MLRTRLTLTAALAVGIAYSVWGAQKTPTAAHASINDAAPGQLAIIGKDGKAAGLCPLKRTDVTADISGYVARVTVKQEFANTSSTPVEAVYTFPLPSDAAVDDMTMTIGTRIIKGQILKREDAREVYESARAAGKAAALLDQERPNIFTQSVANIMPGERVLITISYVNLLKYEDGKYEFVFPMVVGPRFVPAGGYGQSGQRGAPSPEKTITRDPGKESVVTDAEKITPPITPKDTRAGHNIFLTVNLDAGLRIQDVRSKVHEVDARRVGETKAVVRLKNEAEIPNKDFILHYTAAGSEIASGMLHHAKPPQQASAQPLANRTNGYFTLILQPPMAPPQTQISPKEMVFVIDQTGSQSGWPIAKAKEVMKHCINNLNPGDTFQLIGFNTQVFPCFNKPVPANAETIDKALKFLAPLEGRGGTDILKSVDYALQIPDDPNRLRIVCYLTDGYVGNDMQIIDYIRKNRGRARMFPFGIGNSVNRFLIDGMAREGKGVAEYVTVETNAGARMRTDTLDAKRSPDAENIAGKFYKRIASPMLLNVEVDWGTLPVEDVYPKAIPDLFSAGPIILRGRYSRPDEGDVTIRGILRGKPWSQTIQVNLPAIRNDGSAIPTLWAREKIEDLQSQDWLGAQTGNPKPEIQAQIVNTALEYRLMSQYTSFVAVEQRVVNVGGKQRTVDVPVEMPEGVSYEGIFGDKADTLSRGGRMLGRRQRNLSLFGAVPMQKAAGGYAYNAPASLAAAKGLPMLKQQLADESLEARVHGEYKRKDGSTASISRDEVAANKKEAIAELEKLAPESRRELLRNAKLATALRNLPEVFAKEGKDGKLDKPGVPKVEKGRVEVQIWLNALPDDGLAKLKDLGFDLGATLIKDKLLLGSIPVAKLDSLLDLGFVRRLEPPRIR